MTRREVTGPMPEPGELLGVRGLGGQQHVAGERIVRGGRRLDELVAKAELFGEHLWTVNTCHLVIDLDTWLAGEGLLDAESLLYAGLGCYVCEEPFTRRLRTRRCKGQPK